METYIHKVQYYETDKMGITHHSNYIRWFEEARVDFLEKAGMGFEKMEAMGVSSPVMSVKASYKRPTYFSENVLITIRLVRFTGIKFMFSYEVKNAAGELCCTGESEHCFLDETGRPARPKDRWPAIQRIMEENLEKGD